MRALAVLVSLPLLIWSLINEEPRLVVAHSNLLTPYSAENNETVLAPHGNYSDYNFPTRSHRYDEAIDETTDLQWKRNRRSAENGLKKELDEAEAKLEQAKTEFAAAQADFNAKDADAKQKEKDFEDKVKDWKKLDETAKMKSEELINLNRIRAEFDEARTKLTIEEGEVTGLQAKLLEFPDRKGTKFESFNFKNEIETITKYIDNSKNDIKTLKTSITGLQRTADADREAEELQRTYVDKIKNDPDTPPSELSKEEATLQQFEQKYKKSSKALTTAEDRIKEFESGEAELPVLTSLAGKMPAYLEAKSGLASKQRAKEEAEGKSSITKEQVSVAKLALFAMGKEKNKANTTALEARNATIIAKETLDNAEKTLESETAAVKTLQQLYQAAEQKSLAEGKTTTMTIIVVVVILVVIGGIGLAVFLIMRSRRKPNPFFVAAPTPLDPESVAGVVNAKVSGSKEDTVKSSGSAPNGLPTDAKENKPISPIEKTPQQIAEEKAAFARNQEEVKRIVEAIKRGDRRERRGGRDHELCTVEQNESGLVHRGQCYKESVIGDNTGGSSDTGKKDNAQTGADAADELPVRALEPQTGAPATNKKSKDKNKKTPKKGPKLTQANWMREDVHCPTGPGTGPKTGPKDDETETTTQAQADKPAAGYQRTKAHYKDYKAFEDYNYTTAAVTTAGGQNSQSSKKKKTSGKQ